MKSLLSRNDKRGVSPLIATVLLIAFTVALGAVVMNWGRGFVQAQTNEVDKSTNTKIPCSKINVEISSIDSTPQLCYGGAGTAGYLEIRVDNNDEANEIKGFTMVVQGELNTYNNDTINTTIPAGGGAFINLTYSYTTYGKVKQVRIVPKISVGGSITPCGGSPLEKSASEIRNCSST